MTEQDVINAAIREHAGAWFETYAFIYGKDRSAGVFTPKQNYLQRKIQAVDDKMEELGLPKRHMILKPRQKGSTTYSAAKVYHNLRKTAASAVLIGGQFSQVSECWGMMQTYQKFDRFQWGNNGEINTKAGSWANGSKLIGETAKDVQAGIGGTHQILHAFEVARWAKHGVANSSEVLANILKCVPMLPSTLVILESTAEGAVGDFHERFLRAVDAEDFLSGAVTLEPGQYVRSFAGWHEFEDSATRLTEEQKRHIERTLDSDEEYYGERDLIQAYGVEDDGIMRLGHSVKKFDVWEQLSWRRTMIREECKRDRANFDRDYPHSWRVAFQKSGSLRFNSTGLEVMRKRMKTKVPIPGVFEEARGRLGFRQTDIREAKIILFEKPISGRRYILPIDPMTGASQTSGEDPDWHGAHIIRDGYHDANGRWVRAAQAARVVQCRWDIDVLFSASWQLARYYGSRTGCKITVEMNMDRGLTELFKQVGADLYMREVFNKLEFKTTTQLGFQTNPKTRENLIESLAEAIREWDTPGNGIDVYDETTMQQLENFIVDHKGHSKAAEGFHDDDVLALGLGYHLKEHATTYWPQRLAENLPPDLQGVSGKQSGLGSAYS